MTSRGLKRALQQRKDSQAPETENYKQKTLLQVSDDDKGEQMAAEVEETIDDMCDLNLIVESAFDALLQNDVENALLLFRGCVNECYRMENVDDCEKSADFYAMYARCLIELGELEQETQKKEETERPVKRQKTNLVSDEDGEKLDEYYAIALEKVEEGLQLNCNHSDLKLLLIRINLKTESGDKPKALAMFCEYKPSGMTVQKTEDYFSIGEQLALLYYQEPAKNFKIIASAVVAFEYSLACKFTITAAQSCTEILAAHTMCLVEEEYVKDDDNDKVYDCVSESWTLNKILQLIQNIEKFKDELEAEDRQENLAELFTVLGSLYLHASIVSEDEEDEKARHNSSIDCYLRSKSISPETFSPEAESILEELTAS